MKLILGIISISIVLSQTSIETREFKVFKNNKNDKINIMELIKLNLFMLKNLNMIGLKKS